MTIARFFLCLLLEYGRNHNNKRSRHFSPVLEGGLVLGASFDLTNFPNILAENQENDIEILIDSPGGSVFGGFNISNLISRRHKKTTVTVIGMAASIASIIAMSADVVQMSANAMLMIHKSGGFDFGNADDMRKTAEILDKIDSILVGIYVDQIESNGKLIAGDRKKTEKKIMAMLKAETWLNASEAFELGLIDKIVEGREDVTPNQNSDVVGSFSASLKNYKNVPNNILSKYQNNMEEKKTIWANIKGFFVAEIQEDAKNLNDAKTKEVEKVIETEETKPLTDAEMIIKLTESGHTIEAPKTEVEKVENNTLIELRAEIAKMEKNQEALKAQLKDEKFKAAAQSSDGAGEQSEKAKRLDIGEANKNAFDALASLIQSH